LVQETDVWVKCSGAEILYDNLISIPNKGARSEYGNSFLTVTMETWCVLSLVIGDLQPNSGICVLTIKGHIFPYKQGHLDYY